MIAAVGIVVKMHLILPVQRDAVFAGQDARQSIDIAVQHVAYLLVRHAIDILKDIGVDFQNQPMTFLAGLPRWSYHACLSVICQLFTGYNLIFSGHRKGHTANGNLLRFLL